MGTVHHIDDDATASPVVLVWSVFGEPRVLPPDIEVGIVHENSIGERARLCLLVAGERFVHDGTLCEVAG